MTQELLASLPSSMSWPMIHRSWRRRAVTYIETSMIVVILIVVVTTLTPQYHHATNDANFNATVFSLQSIRAEIERYRGQNAGAAPETLDKLLMAGTGLIRIPQDKIHANGDVAISPTSPIAVTGSTGGWIYDPVLGEIRINHSAYAEL